MREFSVSETSYLQTRAGYIAKALVWISARNRVLNTREAIGLWTGDTDTSFMIDGTNRSYLAASGLIGVDPIVMQPGLFVRSQTITVAGFTPEIQQLILGYDVAMAPVEIHRALYDTASRTLIAVPRRIWKGYVDRAPVPSAPLGGEVTGKMTLVSSAQALTKSLTLTWSDATQSRRSGDRILQYADIAGVVRSPWGQS